MTETCTGASPREDALARQRQEIATAVHELRTPLATVQGFLETLMVRGAMMDDATREHVLAIALRNAVLLGQRIDTLLEYERFAMAEVEVCPTPAPLRTAVEHVVEDCAGLLSEHEVVVDIPNDTWAEIDGTALAHVLGNLLGNAAKHSPTGSVITVRTTSDDDEVCLQVIDEGCGIDPDDLPKVFQAFYRGRGRPRGAGLGLSVARRYVDLWGGNLGIESEVDRGTRVAFTLPPAEALVDVTEHSAS